MSKNEITIKQLELSIKHYLELICNGMTENLARRNLVEHSDVYARYLKLKHASPYKITNVSLISEKAKKLVDKNEHKNMLRCEHGYPKKAFVTKLIEMYKNLNNKLDKEHINKFIKTSWDVAYITKEEDEEITKLGYHSKHSSTSKKRWEKCGIKIIDNPYYKKK